MSGKEGFLETISLKDVYTVSLKKEQIVFAASFFVLDVGIMKIGYITNLKVKEDFRGQGMGATFLKDLEAFMKIGLTDAHTKAYLLLNAVPSLEKYYTKRGFSKTQSFFSPWQLKKHTLMSLKIKDDVVIEGLDIEGEQQCELCFSRFGEVNEKRCCGRFCHDYCNNHELFKKILEGKDNGKSQCVFCKALGKEASQFAFQSKQMPFKELINLFTDLSKSFS